MGCIMPYGFKVVAFNKEIGAYLIYGGVKSTIDTQVGKVHKNENGFYLGTDESFVLEYYTELTDDQDIMLVYEYDKDNVKNQFFNLGEQHVYYLRGFVEY